MSQSDTAVLSSAEGLTSFSFGSTNLRFKTPASLERYLEVIEWDNGYLVVLARYKGLPDTEEYIDLTPILRNLYIDPSRFLRNVKKVEISYA